MDILFEEYKCPLLLICSQALLNLFSFNQLSGTVVDLGESGTQISSVIDGYTQYNDCIYDSFLSGRNMNLLFYYEKMKNSNRFSIDKSNFSLDYLDYMNAKSERELISNLYFYRKFFDDIKNEELKYKLIKESLISKDINITKDISLFDRETIRQDEIKIREKLENYKDNDFDCFDAFYFYTKFFRNVYEKENNPFNFIVENNSKKYEEEGVLSENNSKKDEEEVVVPENGHDWGKRERVFLLDSLIYKNSKDLILYHSLKKEMLDNLPPFVEKYKLHDLLKTHEVNYYKF